MTIDAARLMAFAIPEGAQMMTPRDAAFYALSVGCGQDPMDRADLRFVDPVEGISVLPSMAVVIAHPGFWLAHPDSGVDPGSVLHAEQSFELLAPLPGSGLVTSRTHLTRLVDKGPGKPALMWTETLLHDEAGAALARLERTIFLRDGGGFGGQGDAPPPAPVVPDRPCDVTIERATRPEQALLYRLNGDLNPLHSDPDAARAQGFDRPILHGLALKGIICRALLDPLCGGDPDRLSGMRMRFAAPVVPGETIAIDIWREGAFRVRVVERDIVAADNGMASIRT